MNHELHGRWQSFLLRKLPGNPLQLVPDGVLDLNMPHAETGDVESGSSHGPSPGTPSPPNPNALTGRAVPANGGYNVNLQETLPTGGNRQYQAVLIGRNGAQLILGGTRTLNTNNLVDNVEAPEVKKGKAKAPRAGIQSALSQEEGIWVATKP